VKIPNLEVQNNQVRAFEMGLNPATILDSNEWVKPSPDDVRVVLKVGGWTGSQAAEIVKVTSRTVRKWTGGDQNIPFAAWCLLVERAGLGEIWKD